MPALTRIGSGTQPHPFSHARARVLPGRIFQPCFGFAALRWGTPPELVGSHSLRKGGATALFAATGNMELVKRFGGWKSDAVHAYLYSDLHGGEQHGTHMLRSKPALQPQQRSRSTPARVSHSQASDCRAGCIDLDVPSMHVAGPIICSLDVTSRSRSPFCHWCIIALGLSTGAPPFPFTFIAVMAAEPPAPWTDRRMKDWLLEGNNAWDILGVPPGSDLADILRAFRRLSIRYHPDKQLHKTQNEQAESARQYLLISQSRDILTHPTMRALHDDLIARQEAGGWSDTSPRKRRSTLTTHGAPVNRMTSLVLTLLVAQEVGAPATGREAITTIMPLLERRYALARVPRLEAALTLAQEDPLLALMDQAQAPQQTIRGFCRGAWTEQAAASPSLL